MNNEACTPLKTFCKEYRFFFNFLLEPVSLSKKVGPFGPKSILVGVKAKPYKAPCVQVVAVSDLKSTYIEESPVIFANMRSRFDFGVQVPIVLNRMSKSAILNFNKTFLLRAIST